MSSWRIVIEAWPYSTGAGAVADQAGVEPRRREFDVTAHDYAEAHKAALLLATGVESHSNVYRAVIKEVREERA